MDKTPLSILTGAAGTGKTTLIRQIVEKHKALGRQVVLLAPTGRAAKILRDRTGHKASTIHRHIFIVDDFQEHEDAEGNQNTFEYVFTLRNNKDDSDALYIVDEASMVSDVRCEEERFMFGSGRLLSDLLEYIDLSASNNKRQLLFVGDPFQLPPVRSNFSPALSAEYLREKTGLQVSAKQLTTIHRQAEKSGILSNANKLRAAIESQNYTSFRIDSAADVTPCHADAFLPLYRQIVAAENDFTKTTIVVYSNEAARNYNTKVRSWRYPNQSSIQPGDLLQVVKNAYGVKSARDSTRRYDLFNGDLIRVVKVSETIRKQTANLGKDRPTTTVHFRSATVQPIGEDVLLNVLLIEDLLDSPEPGLTDDQTDALYVNFKIRHSHLRPNTKEFSEVYRNDPYVNALCVKYGYAMTCHKAQGGEWDVVFVDYWAGSGRREDFFRWAYTATTRARTKLFAVGVGEINILTKLKFKESAQWQAALAGRAEEESILTPTKLKSYFAKHQIDFRITARHDYHLVATLKSGNSETRFFIYHNKKQLVTKWHIKESANTVSEDKVSPLMQALVGKKLSLEENSLPSSEHAFSTPDDQNNTVSSSQTACSGRQLKIFRTLTEIAGTMDAELELLSAYTKYQMRLKVTKGAGFVILDCHNDKDGFLTSIQPLFEPGTSADLYKAFKHHCQNKANTH